MSNEMKIFLISNMYPTVEHPTYGIFVKNFEESIIKEGHLVAPKVVIEGRLPSLRAKIFGYLKFYRQIIRYGLKKDYDLIYVHYILHSVIPLVLIRPFIKKPVVLNAHGSDILPKSLSLSIVQKMVGRFIRRASLIVVPSDYYRQVVVEKLKAEPSRIFVSPSGGVDIELMKPQPASAKDDLFTVGYVSRIDEGKGWDIYLESLKILKDRFPQKNLKGLMVGDGAQRDDMLARLREYSLEDVVEYVGLKPQGELPRYFSRMDVFVFPTIRSTESLGLVGLEAMACGVPVIGSKIGGLQGYIDEDFNGYLFPPGDAPALAAKIKAFSDLAMKKRKKMSANARNTALRYDKNTISRELAARILSLI